MAKELEFEIRTFDTASLTGSYQNLGAVLSNPVLTIAIFNPSNVGVLISKDGTADNWRVPAGGTLTFDSRDIDEAIGGPSRWILNKGSQLEIKQVTGVGTGTIVINLMEIAY